MKIIDYTLNEIKDDNYNITFTFDDTTKSTQNIYLGRLDTKLDLENAIQTYAKAYLAGITKEKIISKELTDIIGIKQDITIEVITDSYIIAKEEKTKII